MSTNAAHSILFGCMYSEDFMCVYVFHAAMRIENIVAIPFLRVNNFNTLRLILKLSAIWFVLLIVTRFE